MTVRIPALMFAALAAILFTGLTPPALEGQLLDRLKRRAENAVESEVRNALEDRLRDAVRCSLDDQACVDRAESEDGTVVFVNDDGDVITDEDGNPIYDRDDAQMASAELGSEVWSNYDFVPGSDVWFALDLESERVGRFPARQLEFVSGNAQVVERDGIRTIEFTAPTTFRVNLPEILPDDYALEMTYQAGVRNAFFTVLGQYDGTNLGGYDYSYLYLFGNGGIFSARQPLSASDTFERIDDEMLPIKLQVDRDPEMPEGSADYAIVYAGTTRAAMVPNANFERSNQLEFRVTANSSRPAYLSELIVSVHGDPLYDALTTGERMFTTRGILFDFDSDRLRGESRPTLAELVSTLERSADLNVVIEGHTDGQGEEDYNEDLSERRAEAVVAYLVEQGIDAGRLQAVGMGESMPVADDETEAGRQSNRRVVIRGM